MAQKRTKNRKTESGAKRQARSTSEKPEKYRFAQNTEGGITAAESTYREYAAKTREKDGDNGDVLVDVPAVKVDSIHLEVENLDAQVSLKTEVLELLDIDIGANVKLGKLKLEIKGVEAQALLRVRLDHVAAIVDRVMTTLDRNPELVKGLGKAAEQVSKGTADTLGGAGGAAEEIGEGAEGALGDVGAGAGEAVGEVGSGANAALGDIGEGAGEAVGEISGGAAGIAGKVAEGTLGADDLINQKDQLDAKSVAKAAALLIIKELGSAAGEEAQSISHATKEKVRELREGSSAENKKATPAAKSAAEDLGVSLSNVRGSGQGGRVVVADVRRANETS